LHRYQRLVGQSLLIAAAPGLSCVVLLSAWSPSTAWVRFALVAGVICSTLLLLRARQRRLLFPLHTMGSLLEALREGDYTLRAASHSPLGDLVFHFNALADRLQRERLEFEESTHLLRKTLASLGSAVFAFDEGNRLRLLNPAAQRLMDSERHLLFGRTADELGLGAWLEGPASLVLAHRFPGRDGRFEVRRTSLRSGGRGGHLLVINDMSAVLREEEQLAWQRLLRVLGHEVNNSLAPIQSVAGVLARMVEREPLPADWREDFRSGMDVIAHRAEALGRFLSSYGKLTRLPAPQRAPVDVGALIGNLARLEQRLVICVATEATVVVQADADQLEQALLNLLKNAVDAAVPNDGGVRVYWTVEAGRLRIDIEDDGPGPPPSANLFVPFFTTKPGGSGIGLALSRQIAEAHCGSLELEARSDGAGAIASLWLPLTGDDHETWEASRARRAPTGIS
jgi:nitrogen fixation/metabolism regulation signal transduction histidine kinase